MSDKPVSRPRVSSWRPHQSPGVQHYIFELHGDDRPLPGLEDFFPEAPTVPVADVPDLDFERSRRRFTQGA